MPYEFKRVDQSGPDYEVKLQFATHTWMAIFADEDPLNVDCTTCGETAGNPCVTGGGSTTDPHKARRLDAGYVEVDESTSAREDRIRSILLRDTRLEEVT